jgi:hypothetical protein
MSHSNEQGSPARAECSEVVVVHQNNHTFNSAASVINYLRSVEPESQYTEQSSVLTKMLQYHEKASDMIEEVYHFIQQSGAYRNYLTDDAFNKRWVDVQELIKENKRRRDRHAEATNRVAQHWKDDAEGMAWLQSVTEKGPSRSFLDSVRSISKSLPFSSVCLRLNHLMARRLLQPRQGVTKSREPQSGEIDVARLMTIDPPPVPESTLKQLGMVVGPYGIIQDRAKLPSAIEVVEGGEDDLAEPANGVIEVRDGDVVEPAEEARPCLPGPAGETFVPDEDDESEVEFVQHVNTAESDDDLALTSVQDDLIDAKAIQEAKFVLEKIEREDQETFREEADETDDSEGRPAKRVKRERRRPCGCGADVSKNWCRAVVRRRAFDEVTNMRLLATMQSFTRVCYFHSKAMGGHIGLMLKHLNALELSARLRAVHGARLNLGGLKTAHGTHTWFRVKNRPARPSDALGPYKFAHNADVPEFDFDQSVVLESISPGLKETWLRDGNLIADVFQWWFTPGCQIGEICLLEFDMYQHHLRKINGKSNYGWLRNMFYSTGQQLMRQDPLYYMLYAALRPDKAWRLVTYPYYAKFAQPGDNTYFRHLDLNIPTLLSQDRGCNMIQGSVSLDDESEESCTVIVPGMQKKLGEWWERCKSRGQETDGFVHRITDRILSAEDLDALGLAWKRVPCRRGEVRVTLPHIPHGQDGPAKLHRRTMLPWMVALQDDLENLEIVEAGSFSELSAAHRDMISPRATPSGLANRYGAIPYRFAAAVEISGLSALSDALVCRRRWDSPAVLRDRDILLGPDRKAAMELVTAIRSKMPAAAVDALHLIREVEMRAFGEKSFFYHKERHDLHGIPFPVVEPDPEVVSEDDSYTPDMAFAEEGVESEVDDLSSEDE